MDPSTWDQRLALIRAEGLSAIVDAVMGRFFSDAFRVQHPEVVETVRTGMLAQNPDGYCGLGGTGVACQTGVAVSAAASPKR